MFRFLAVASGMLVLLLTVILTTHQAKAQAVPSPRIAIMGDSMSTGYGASPGQGYVNLLDNDYNSQGGDVEAFAVNGATALRWINCPTNPTLGGCEAAYAGQFDRLKNYNPTRVLITLGGNELIISRPASTYASHMQQLANKVRSLVPNASISFVRYYDITKFGFQRPAPGTICDLHQGQCNGYTTYSSWSQYGDWLRFVAAFNNIQVIDISTANFTRSHVIDDLVHLNNAGQLFYYNTLKPRL